MFTPRRFVDSSHIVILRRLCGLLASSRAQMRKRTNKKTTQALSSAGLSFQGVSFGQLRHLAATGTSRNPQPALPRLVVAAAPKRDRNARWIRARPPHMLFLAWIIDFQPCLPHVSVANGPFRSGAEVAFLARTHEIDGGWGD